jgi:hypothetical protein
MPSHKKLVRVSYRCSLTRARCSSRSTFKLSTATLSSVQVLKTHHDYHESSCFIKVSITRTFLFWVVSCWCALRLRQGVVGNCEVPLIQFKSEVTAYTNGNI